MNLGWLDSYNKGDYDFEAAKGKATVVIHEFGHALGMIHEHSRSDTPLPWNCKAVYETLGGPPNNWNKQMVDGNVFDTESLSNLYASPYDPKSIMHYYFPDKYFMEPVGLPQNTELSCLDICWLRKMYPKNV